MAHDSSIGFWRSRRATVEDSLSAQHCQRHQQTYRNAHQAHCLLPRSKISLSIRIVLSIRVIGGPVCLLFLVTKFDVCRVEAVVIVDALNAVIIRLNKLDINTLYQRVSPTVSVHIFFCSSAYRVKARAMLCVFNDLDGRIVADTHIQTIWDLQTLKANRGIVLVI